MTHHNVLNHHGIAGIFQFSANNHAALVILNDGHTVGIPLGFDQIFNMSNPAVEESLDVLDTYIYRITFQASSDFSFSTAISLMKSVVNFLLVLLANFSSKRLTDNGLFE